MANKKLIPWHLVSILLFSLYYFNCSMLQEVASIRKPQLDVQNVRFIGMTFDKVDLAFDINIQNPNPLAIRLAGLDYNFKINNSSFLQGQKSDQLAIEANANSMVEIPLTLFFKDIYNVFQTLMNQDSSEYQIESTLYFDLPVLGKTPIAVGKKGHLPLIKLPSIKISSLQLKNINFSGANLELKLGIANPNAFRLFLNRFNYDFSINGVNWITGKTDKLTEINEKGEAVFNIPISLDFLKMGQTVYQLLQGNRELNYQFNSDLDLKSSIPLLSQINLPITKSGQINVIR